ncbi:MAG: bacteriocin [Bradyrhizobium sp.]
MTNDYRELSAEELSSVSGGGIIESALNFAGQVLRNYQINTVIEGLQNVNKPRGTSPMGTPA